jgi:hypothetical protein
MLLSAENPPKQTVTPSPKPAASAPAPEPSPSVAEEPASEPVVVARLPRVRPDEPLVTGSIARRDAAEIRKRIRRLHERPFRRAYPRYHAYVPPPPAYAHRVPPPLLYEW